MGNRLNRFGRVQEIAEDYELYTEMMGYMENTDFTIDENYAYACELLDMQSFIDYFAAEIYYGRYGDWPVSNFAVWRTRETGEGTYEDGKWRWLLPVINSAANLSRSLDVTSPPPANKVTVSAI